MDLIHELTLGGMIKKTARSYPLRPAMEYAGQRWSYERLDRETDELAVRLLHQGIARHSRVGLWADSHPNALLCLYALLKLGAVPVLVGAARTPEELAARLAEAGSGRLLFHERVRGVLARDVLPPEGLPGVESIAIGENSPMLDGLSRSDGRIPGELTAAMAAVTPEDMDMILFTSGSSGSPKGVMTTHFSRVNNALAQAEMLSATCEDRFCGVLPLFHCFALSGTVLAALAVGACLCIPQSRHTGDILAVVQDCRCTVLTAVPTLFSAILARGDLDRWDLRSLRTGLIGGSCYPPELFEAVCRQLDMTLLPSLGQTEATAGITAGRLSDPLHTRAHTVGRFLPHVEGEIQDPETGRAVPAGTRGEICVRGYNVMQGYCNAGTEGVLDDKGWLHTGDLGWLDFDGNLHLAGRLKELIIKGGENVVPAEIEAVLATVPGVRGIKVVGVPDSHYMEEICACVEGRPDESALRAAVMTRLGPGKVPQYILFFPQLPQTSSGKIDGKTLREEAMARLGLKELTQAPSQHVQ